LYRPGLEEGTVATSTAHSQPTRDDLLTFVCWNCERGISVPRAKAGRRGRCPSCRAPQRVPGGADRPQRTKRSPEQKTTPTRAVVARSRTPRPRRRRSQRRQEQGGGLPMVLMALGFALVAFLILVGLAV
jgi:hypothetical protein